jgi:hypothetical protein
MVAGKPLNTRSGLDIRGRSSFRFFSAECARWALAKKARLGTGALLTSVYFAPSSFSASAAARFS